MITVIWACYNPCRQYYSCLSDKDVLLLGIWLGISSNRLTLTTSNWWIGIWCPCTPQTATGTAPYWTETNSSWIHSLDSTLTRHFFSFHSNKIFDALVCELQLHTYRELPFSASHRLITMPRLIDWAQPYHVTHGVEMNEICDWSIRILYLLFLDLNLNCHQFNMIFCRS